MSPEFSRLVEGAAEIAASGRWAAVKERIRHLTANPEVDNDWWITLFASLCFHTCSEYRLLKRAHRENGGAPLLAWRARNLLELSVWSMYCAKSRQYARRFYEDAGRDELGLYSAFTTWGVVTAQSADWLQPIANAKQDLSQRAAAAGIDSLDGVYKRVHEAAKECGLGDHFSLYFTMLSKFAHPTAMHILAPPDEARDALQKDCFFSQGCLFFTGAFVALEGQLI